MLNGKQWLPLVPLFLSLSLSLSPPHTLQVYNADVNRIRLWCFRKSNGIGLLYCLNYVCLLTSLLPFLCKFLCHFNCHFRAYVFPHNCWIWFTLGHACRIVFCVNWLTFFFCKCRMESTHTHTPPQLTIQVNCLTIIVSYHSIPFTHSPSLSS